MKLPYLSNNKTFLYIDTVQTVININYILRTDYNVYLVIVLVNNITLDFQFYYDML